MGAAFDTLSAFDDLQEAGFSPAQARALSQTMARLQGNLATRQDIGVLKSDSAFLRPEMDAFRTEMRAGFAALQKEISALRTAILSVLLPIMLVNLGLTVTLLIQIQPLRG